MCLTGGIEEVILWPFFCFKRLVQFDESRRAGGELNLARDKNANHEPEWVGGAASYSVTPGLQ